MNSWDHAHISGASRPIIKQYSTTPETVEAAKVALETIDGLAKWCGGQKSSVQTSDEGPVTVLLVPRIGGNLQAEIGEWLVRDKESGRFSVLTETEFSKFKEVGMRDKPQPRTPHIWVGDPPGTGILRNSGDPRYPHDALDLS
jgi:hypothetical protein